MVYRRTYRKKTYRKKRTYRRRFRARTRYSKRGQKSFLYTRYTGALGTLTISSITNTLAAYNFSLVDIPSYTEFTSLYDVYKLNAVKVSFIPQMTQNVSLGAINNPIANARFFSVIDYNDSTAPSTIEELREYKTCKYTPILRTHKRYIYKPKLVDSISSVRTSWLATSSASANHFGLKVAVEPMLSTTTTTMTYNIEAKYYLSFRNVK